MYFFQINSNCATGITPQLSLLGRLKSDTPLSSKRHSTTENGSGSTSSKRFMLSLNRDINKRETKRMLKFSSPSPSTPQKTSIKIKNRVQTIPNYYVDITEETDDKTSKYENITAKNNNTEEEESEIKQQIATVKAEIKEMKNYLAKRKEYDEAISVWKQGCIDALDKLKSYYQPDQIKALVGEMKLPIDVTNLD